MSEFVKTAVKAGIWALSATAVCDGIDAIKKCVKNRKAEKAKKLAWMACR